MLQSIAPDSLQNTAHLAIETTARIGSLAVLSGGRVLRTSILDADRRTAATLAPAIEETFQWCQAEGHQLKFISVADGPGSFTGLRIGVTTAKSLSYALGLPLISVDSLAAIAAVSFQAEPQVESLLVTLDAYRGQVFAGLFERSDLLPPIDSIPDSWCAHPPASRVMSRQDWNNYVARLPDETACAGDVMPQSDSRRLLDRACDAVGAGVLAIRAAAKGDFIDPLSLVPRYMRLSAAEEKAAKG